MPTQKASAIFANSMKNEYQFMGPRARRAYEERAIEIRKTNYTREDLDRIEPFPQLELIARCKHIDGYEHWKPEDREQVICLILLFQIFEQGGVLPILSYDELNQFPIYMLKVIGFIRNINGYKHWKLNEKAIEKIMTSQGNRNDITNLAQLKMTELKDIGKNLGIKGAYRWKKEDRAEAIRLIEQVQATTGVDIVAPVRETNRIYSSEELRQKQMKELKKIGQQLNIKGRAEWRANQKSRIVNDILRAQAEREGDRKTAEEIGKVMIHIKLDARLLRQMNMDILKGIADGYDIPYDDGSRDAPQLKNKLIRLITNAASGENEEDKCKEKLLEQKQEFDNNLEQYEEKITEKAYEEVRALQTELTSNREYYEDKIAEMKEQIRILEGSVSTLVSEKVEKSLSAQEVENEEQPLAFSIPSPILNMFEEKEMPQPLLFESPTGYYSETSQQSPTEPSVFEPQPSGIGESDKQFEPLLSPAVGDRYLHEASSGNLIRPNVAETFSNMNDLPDVNNLFGTHEPEGDIILGVRKCLGLEDAQN